ncbi:hypothetical protein [Fictibacillus norfolkensis]|uniref:DUF3953 domain-containing protein n=1 Tax=Fictibacillus norfolkensis TaxID=2762233 RepID=A0ABR8SKP5_9BACL|nr:hypothetical protein [Fictibacillus norfolkensis]MBD7964040.1 hypothetical protein [Fictibacillus norfolkensis]
MKKSSTWSLVLLMLGLLIIFNGDFLGHNEWMVLGGFLIILLGAMLCFVAFFQNEKGNAKFINLALSILVIFIITWYRPFEIIRIISWLKNIS